MLDTPEGAMSRRGNWAVDFPGSCARTIAAGTSEIQKNIIGERVLGLPKKVRMDRMPTPSDRTADR
jgi:alkylation response protein AidB-like acyl-CoA dehydrogenase